MKTKSVLFLLLIVGIGLIGYGQTVPCSLDQIKVPPTFQQTEGEVSRGTFYRNMLKYEDQKKFPQSLKGAKLYLQYQSTNIYSSTEEFDKAGKIYQKFYKNLFQPKPINNWGAVTLNNTREQDISLLKPGEASDVVVYDADVTFQWFCMPEKNTLKKFTIMLVNNFEDDLLYVTEEFYATDPNPVVPPAELLDFPVHQQSEFRPEKSFIQYACNSSKEVNLISAQLLFESKLSFAETVEWFKKNGAKEPRFVKQDINSDSYAFQDPKNEYSLLIISKDTSANNHSPKVLITYPLHQVKLYHQVIINGKIVITN
ncbi:hypothetical protein [Tenuifilum osseticum]|uniref:hypothetical protein n=1 Tax=Tenuifilum osseticum TaxID=3374723 RepID=UPI0034E3ADE6